MMLTKLAVERRDFTEDDAISALEAVFQAMLVSEYAVHEAEQEHFFMFAKKLFALGMDISIFANEPYLEEVALNFQFQFVRIMETLFIRAESYLHDVR